jgi:hypothetical protein
MKKKQARRKVKPIPAGYHYKRAFGAAEVMRMMNTARWIS